MKEKVVNWIAKIIAFALWCGLIGGALTIVLGMFGAATWMLHHAMATLEIKAWTLDALIWLTAALLAMAVVHIPNIGKPKGMSEKTWQEWKKLQKRLEEHDRRVRRW